MIELTSEQRRELDGPEFARARDPETGQVYILVQAEQYEKIRKIIDGVSRRSGWDEPEMDEYEIYRKKKA
jgi:hypothetical protein